MMIDTKGAMAAARHGALKSSVTSSTPHVRTNIIDTKTEQLTRRKHDTNKATPVSDMQSAEQPPAPILISFEKLR